MTEIVKNVLFSFNNGSTRAEDIFAGLTLHLTGIFGVMFYGLVAAALYQLGITSTGFRFLFSQALAEILLFIQFGIWPGLLALLSFDPLPVASRRWVQLYMDTAWFATVWHYPLVAASRYWAIRWPMSFRDLRYSTAYAICAVAWVAGFAQAACTRLFDWYVVFYFEPQSYGTVAEDFDKYKRGQARYFLTTHIVLIGVSIMCYALTVFELVRMRQHSLRSKAAAQQTTVVQPARNNLTNASSTSATTDMNVTLLANGRVAQTQRQASSGNSAGNTSAERKLAVSCALHTAAFIVGQVLITLGVASGKWLVFTCMYVFVCNAMLNPVFLMLMSPLLRDRVWLLVTRQKPSDMNRCRSRLPPSVNNSKQPALVANHSQHLLEPGHGLGQRTCSNRELQHTLVVPVNLQSTQRSASGPSFDVSL